MAGGMWFVNTSNLDTEACIARVAWETYVQHNGFVKATTLTECTSVPKGKTDFLPALSQEGNWDTSIHHDKQGHNPMQACVSGVQLGLGRVPLITGNHFFFSSWMLNATHN